MQAWSQNLAMHAVKSELTVESNLTLNSPRTTVKTWQFVPEQKPSLFRYPKDLLSLHRQTGCHMSRIHLLALLILHVRQGTDRQTTALTVLPLLV